MFNKHPALSRAVMVSLYSGTGIQGVLAKTVGHHYVLKGVTVFEPDVEPAPADGEIVIDAANVDYIQVLRDA